VQTEPFVVLSYMHWLPWAAQYWKENLLGWDDMQQSWPTPPQGVVPVSWHEPSDAQVGPAAGEEGEASQTSPTDTQIAPL
jgi:hypothetical protein